MKLETLKISKTLREFLETLLFLSFELFLQIYVILFCPSSELFFAPKRSFSLEFISQRKLGLQYQIQRFGSFEFLKVFFKARVLNYQLWKCGNPKENLRKFTTFFFKIYQILCHTFASSFFFIRTLCVIKKHKTEILKS